MKNNKGFTLIEFLVVSCILFVFLASIGSFIIPFLGFKGIEYSEGQRTGVNYKLSKKGLIWSTYEGELSLQLITRDGEGAMVNQIFVYSVSDPSVARELETLSTAGKPITVTYKQYKFRGYRYGDTPYDVTGVKQAELSK